MRRAPRLAALTLAALAAFLFSWSATGLATGNAACIPAIPAQMGACTPRPLTAPLHLPTITGRLGVDVSSYQGSPDWAAAKRDGLRFAIDKAGESTTYSDPTFARNWAAQRSLRIPHGAYWFIRPASCAGQADLLAEAIHAAGVGPRMLPPVGDAEVPLPTDCVPQFVAELHHQGFPRVVIYTAPGTWPGGGDPGADLWVATYGPAPGCVWACEHVAWQFSGGNAGPLPHTWPGIGTVDVDQDTGLLALQRGTGQLAADRARHARLLALRRRHRCWASPPRPPRYRGACQIWLGEIRALDRKIAKETNR